MTNRPLYVHNIHSNCWSAFLASQSFIHLSVHPSREADSLGPVAQDRASLQGTVAGFVPLSCLEFPRLAVVPLHACSVGKQDNQPASRGNQHPSRQPVSHPSIHSYIWTADFLYPPGPEQGFSLGDSSRLCSPPSCLTFPRSALGPPSRHRALGGARASLRPHFSFSFGYYRSFRPPPHHTTTPLFFMKVFYWCPFLFCLFFT